MAAGILDQIAAPRGGRWAKLVPAKPDGPRVVLLAQDALAGRRRGADSTACFNCLRRSAVAQDVGRGILVSATTGAQGMSAA